MTFKEIVTAAFIIIGNEILSGRTKDKNLAYAGERLNQYGVRLMEARVVPDIEDTIIRTVNELRETYDYVFTSGGIGPTHDDITSETMAKAFGVEWAINDEAFKILEDYYAAGDFTPARQKMAMIPAGARLIPNPVSGAPGFNIGNVFVMAGIPSIMQAMLDHAAPSLTGGAVVISQTVVTGFPESQIAEDLTAIQADHPSVDIGSYPRYENGRFQTSLVVRSSDQAAIDAAVLAINGMVEGK